MINFIVESCYTSTMPNEARTSCREILATIRIELIDEWVRLQLAELSSSGHGLRGAAVQGGIARIPQQPSGRAGATNGRYISSPEFSRVRENLEAICTSRLTQGFTPPRWPRLSFRLSSRFSTAAREFHR